MQDLNYIKVRFCCQSGRFEIIPDLFAVQRGRLQDINKQFGNHYVTQCRLGKFLQPRAGEDVGVSKVRLLCNQLAVRFSLQERVVIVRSKHFLS